jgi:hypothetical protein
MEVNKNEEAFLVNGLHEPIISESLFMMYRIYLRAEKEVSAHRGLLLFLQTNCL